MRRISFVVFAVFGATLIACSATLAVQAQTAQQYDAEQYDARVASQPEGASQASREPARASTPESEAKAPPPPPKNVDEFSAAGAGDRVLNAVPDDPYSQVVDNATRGRFSAPGWKTVKDSSANAGGYVRLAGGPEKDARFMVEVPETGYYTVYAHWPRSASNTSSARLGVSTADGVRWDEVDQRIDGDDWVTVGAFELERGARVPVLVSPGKKGGDTVADAVMVSKNVLVGTDAQMASVADPDLSSDRADAQDASATMDISARNSVRERRSVVRAARNHLGNPYDFNHARCRRGMAREDCSCFTRNVFARFGKTLPDSPVYQWNYGQKVSKANTHRGDLVFQDLNKDGDLKDHYADHVSIYSGNGFVIHASSYFGKVVESKERYLDRYWGSKRLRVN